ncbi:hypothetical protein CHUAL_002679 [Chamberlinius hualienensis]
MLKSVLYIVFTYTLATVLCESDIEDKNYVVVLNLTAETILECNMSESAVNISWMKNGAPISWATLPNYSQVNNSLIISSGTDPDAGTYVCAAGNDFSRNITFHVKSRVRVEKFEKSINAVQGDKLVLTCKAYGNPKPEVTWYKDNNLLKETNETSRIKFKEANNLTNSQLVIDPLEETDRAVYRCDVINDVNNATVTVMVRVKVSRRRNRRKKTYDSGSSSMNSDEEPKYWGFEAFQLLGNMFGNFD